MFEGQPKGLYALALANTGERFGYYTMLAVFVLFLKANFGWSAGTAGAVYSGFLAFVYFLPLVGGILADKVGYGKCVTTGIFVMFLGYLLLAIPAGAGMPAVILLFAALVFICVGTSLFKGNLQVMVGNLYEKPELEAKRDSAFSIFYMAINIGALFAPRAAVEVMKFAQDTFGVTEADAYHYAFGVACISLVVSIAIYYAFRRTFAHADFNAKTKAATTGAKEPELSAKETKDRIVALCLVFAVVIFFWMAFHQNGLTLTLFAEEYTNTQSFGVESMMFDVWNLVLCIVIVYALFAVFQSKTTQARLIAGAVILVCVGVLAWKYTTITPEGIEVTAPIFQQFNPCFVVGLTPVSLAIFGWLAKKGKEPSAPRKIGLGMLVAACGFVVMTIGSIGLEQGQRVSPNWLVSTYLVLTFGELLLSPMGISFVSKVAPPKYKGLMMGGWFVATAIGNFLVAIPGFLWGNVSLVVVWGVLVALCLLSALFIFSIMKRLEKVC
ncbi:MAG: peptide MFS transporter [Alloprevotella sp.]|nr:peptide MFS transporter [Alloprevotella sp.]